MVAWRIYHLHGATPKLPLKSGLVNDIFAIFSPGYNGSGLEATTTPTWPTTLTAYSFSMWVNPAALTNASGTGVDLIGFDYTHRLAIDTSSGTLSGWIGADTTYGQAYSASGSALAPQTGWHYVVMTYAQSDTGGPHLFLDGNEVTYSYRTPPVGNAAAGNGMGIAEYPGYGGWGGNFNGSMSEARIAGGALSSNWILTEFNNQNNPTGFIAVRPQQ